MKHGRQGFAAWFIRQAMQNEEIQLFGNGHQVRDLNYVDDVVEAMLLSAVYDGADNCTLPRERVGLKDHPASPVRDGVPVFNLGNLPPVSLLEFVSTLLEVCQEFGVGKGGYRLVPFPTDKKRIDIGDYYGNYAKIQQTLGWRPTVSLREGLRNTVSFYMEHRDHYWSEGEVSPSTGRA